MIHRRNFFYHWITDHGSRIADRSGLKWAQLGAHTMHGPAHTHGLPLYWGWVGNRLVFAINDNAGLAVKQLLNSTRARPDYLPTVPGTGGAYVAHINWGPMFKILEGIARMQGAEQELGKMQTVIQTLGLDDLKRLTVGTGYDGLDVVSNAVLETAQPLTGLLAHFKTIDLTMFDAVSAGAMNASAFNCDVAGVYDTMMKMLSAVLGQEFAQIESIIVQLETGLKIKVRDGLLKSIDGQMVFYSAPGGPATGSIQGAFALVAKLKDQALWEETLAALGQFAAGQSEGMLQISAQDHGGTTMHVWTAAPLALLSLMPGWAVVGDRVVIASNPTFLRSAVDQLASGKASIRNSVGFKQATAKLPSNPLSLEYSDSKAQFNQMMLGLQQFWPMATMGAMRAGVKLPPILPNLSHIAEKMGPSCRYAWSDDQGLRSHYRGTGIEPSIGAVAGASLGLGIMMPALARTRQMAKRMQSATHLSNLGKALLIYANDYSDAFPLHLEALVEKAAIDARMLESSRKPKHFEGPSYVYITGQTTAMDPRNVVVYENPGYCQEGLNVLYLDSHVAWTKKEKFLQQLQATYKRLDRDMPDIRFQNE
jgi:hypothetical protein